MKISDSVAADKAAMLAEILGSDPMTLAEEAVYGGDCPGICSREGCDYVEDTIEPDSDSGWCPDCRKNSVVSILRLMHIM